MAWKKKERTFYFFGHLLSSSITYLLFRPRIIGRENLPKKGRVIIAPNHRTLLDVPVLGCATMRPLRFMAKKDLFKYRFVKWYFETNGSFSVDKTEGDPKAVRKALAVLNNEDALVVFPEGRRVRGMAIGELATGVGFLAVKGKAPIVPVGISNLDKPISRKRFFIPIFTRARVVIGKPITSHLYMDAKTSEIVSHVMQELAIELEDVYSQSVSV